MWIDGDWDAGLEGQFFPEWDRSRHVIEPFTIPSDWIRFRACDWGSAAVPFSIGWYAVVEDDIVHPASCSSAAPLIRYREYYGMVPGKPNVGVKTTVEEVGAEIAEPTEDGEDIRYGVIDPSAYAVSRPLHRGNLFASGVCWRRADNRASSVDKKMGGWDIVRARLKRRRGRRTDAVRVLYVPSLIRTLPMMLHDPIRPEDLDTTMEDHAVDELRYSCMSRPFRAHEWDDAADLEARNPYRISNAFRLDELD